LLAVVYPGELFRGENVKQEKKKGVFVMISDYIHPLIKDRLLVKEDSFRIRGKDETRKTRNALPMHKQPRRKILKPGGGRLGVRNVLLY